MQFHSGLSTCYLLDHQVVTDVLEEMGFKAGTERGVGCSMSVSCRDQPR